MDRINGVLRKKVQIHKECFEQRVLILLQAVEEHPRCRRKPEDVVKDDDVVENQTLSEDT